MLSLFMVVGCDSNQASKPTITIQKIKPSGEQALIGNEVVMFEVTLLPGNVPKGSSAAIVIQSSDGTVIGTDGPKAVVSGELINLSAQVKIPMTTSVEINAPLFMLGKSETGILDYRHYNVVGFQK
jgi:hypothetical protein